MRLTGYPVGEVAGNHLLLGRLIVFRPVRGDGVFGGVILEAGNVWESTADMTLPTLRHSAAAAIGFRTLLGPVYLGYGLGDGNRRRTTLTIKK
jgi:NTE family protein